MTKEEILEAFMADQPVYDSKNRVLYIPDVNGEGLCYGVQRYVINPEFDNEDLAASLRSYNAQKDTAPLLEEWCIDHIPAPGSFASVIEGRSYFDSWYINSTPELKDCRDLFKQYIEIDIFSDCRASEEDFVASDSSLFLDLMSYPKYLLDCQMITRDGKIVQLHECPDDGLYHDYDLHLTDGMDRLYQKELWSTKIFRCDPSGTPGYAVGKLDVVSLWNDFNNVPVNSETDRIEADWGSFPAGTGKDVICHWFEVELGVSVNDLLYHTDKVDRELLTFKADDFNLDNDIVLDRSFLLRDDHRFAHTFKNQEGCIIYKEENVSSLSDKWKGVEQYLVLGNWKRSDSMPLGEYATWIVSNDTPDKSFCLKNGVTFPSCFYDSKKSVVNAVKEDFASRLAKERARVSHENEAFMLEKKDNRDLVH